MQLNGIRSLWNNDVEIARRYINTARLPFDTHAATGSAPLGALIEKMRTDEGQGVTSATTLLMILTGVSAGLPGDCALWLSEGTSSKVSVSCNLSFTPAFPDGSPVVTAHASAYAMTAELNNPQFLCVCECNDS